MGDVVPGVAYLVGFVIALIVLLSVGPATTAVFIYYWIIVALLLILLTSYSSRLSLGTFYRTASSRARRVQHLAGEAQRAVDATRARMEEARTIRGPGGLVARIRLPQRGEARSFEKGAAPAKRREPESDDEVASRVETLKIFALGGVALLMVPVFLLSMADPMAPPSPELAARLAAELS